MVQSLIARLRGDRSSSDPADDGPTGDSDSETTTDPDRDAADDPEDSNDLWDLIPSWEYDGKYVQSGGHSRGEQERAIEDIQRQADAIEASDDAEKQSET